MKRPVCWLLIFTLGFFCACNAPAAPEQDIAAARPVLQVCIASGTEAYAGVHILRNEETRGALEDTLGVQLELVDLYPEQDSSGTADVEFKDVLLVDNPLQIVPLAARNQLLALFHMEMEDPTLGKYQGLQYGYIFSHSNEAASQPVLAVLPEVLELADIRKIPFTPEAVLQALEKLSVVDTSVVADIISTPMSDIAMPPLAVYGMPSGAGFGPLLALFDMAPLGGNDICVADGTVVFDKLEPNAKAYLAYVRALYEKRFIPDACLLQTEYSAMELLINGRCFMAVLPNEAFAQMVVTRAAANGNRIALVKLPVPEACTEVNVYNRLTGMVAKGSQNAELAKRFLVELQRMSNLTETKLAMEAEWYPLFVHADTERMRRVDLVDEVLTDIRRLYEKNMLDTTYIEPYYCRIVTGDLPLEAFDTMKEQWLLTNHDTNRGEFSSGKSLMDLYNRWYAAGKAG